jgi:hypothetical protein
MGTEQPRVPIIVQVRHLHETEWRGQFSLSDSELDFSGVSDRSGDRERRAHRGVHRYRGAQTTSISKRQESTEARTLRNHLDSSPAQGVHAYKPPHSDLVIRHRLIHANRGPVSERHIVSGVPDGDTTPVASVMETASSGAVSTFLDREMLGNVSGIR